MQRIANPSSRIRMHRFESCTLRQLKACCKSRLFLYLISVYRDNAANMFPIYAGAAVNISNADRFLAESVDLI